MQIAAPHVRTLLVPERQLSRELRVLIDARFNLKRAVHQFCFWKVVHDRRPIVRVVAPARDPSDQVVPVGRRERQDLDELRRLLAGQLHQDEVRLHRLLRLLARALSPTSLATVQRSSRL